MTAAKKLLTLTMVHDRKGGRVLLGLKKRGFGAGKWNGFGGKVEAGETVEAAAERELREEAGIAATDLAVAGVLTFHSGIYKDPLEVHVFRAERWTGEPVETEEMRPQWFKESEIPLDEMFPDDRLWHPHFFSGTFFSGSFRFDEEGNIVHHELRAHERAP